MCISLSFSMPLSLCLCASQLFCSSVSIFMSFWLPASPSLCFCVSASLSLCLTVSASLFFSVSLPFAHTFNLSGCFTVSLSPCLFSLFLCLCLSLSLALCLSLSVSLCLLASLCLSVRVSLFLSVVHAVWFLCISVSLDSFCFSIALPFCHFDLRLQHYVQTFHRLSPPAFFNEWSGIAQHSSSRHHTFRAHNVCHRLLHELRLLIMSAKLIYEVVVIDNIIVECTLRALGV